MKKAKSAKLSETALGKERIKDADQLEAQRLLIQRELEEAVEEYASITGYKKIAARKYKVGKAPNDWQKG